MARATDDERRRVAERLRRLNAPSLIALMSILGVGGRDMCARLADLIEPDTTSDTTSPVADTTKCDPTEHGIDSIYEWCFSGIEGADEDEDELFCAIMQAIEDYRHPERVTARTARAVARKALLGLADEMDRWALTCDHYDRQVSPLDVTKYARRIREACGVVA